MTTTTRSFTSKYPGTCTACSTRFPAGTELVRGANGYEHLECPTVEAETAAAPVQVAPLTPGVYQVDGEVFIVKPNRDKTRLYAKRLVEINGDRLTDADTVVQIDFEYAPGAIYRIRESHRMPLDQAEALSIRYGRCIACGRKLKAAKSVREGIGPVCRTYFGHDH